MGVRVVILTDHSSLTWLKSFKQPESQLARWLERLAEFDFVLQYRKGSAAANADGLSRRPCPEKCSYCSRREEKDLVHCNLVDIVDPQYDWTKEQGNDPVLCEVAKWISDGNKPVWEVVSGADLALKTL